FHVTGVQTCALPIFPRRRRGVGGVRLREGGGPRRAGRHVPGGRGGGRWVVVGGRRGERVAHRGGGGVVGGGAGGGGLHRGVVVGDRKSTRLNSSHVK